MVLGAGSGGRRVSVWGEGFLDLDTLGDKSAPLNYTNYAEEARLIRS